VEIHCTVTNQDGKGVADVLAPTEKVKIERPQLPEITVI